MRKRIFISLLPLVLVAVAYAGAPKYPKFELYTIDTKLKTSLGLRGQAVMIAFFARSCPPCRMEVPFFNSLHEKYPDTLTILGIAFYENDYHRLLALIKDWGIRYPVCPDQTGMVGKAFDVYVFPSTFLMDHRGEIIATYKGLSDKFNRDIIKKIEELEPLIKVYREKGPMFYVSEFKEDGEGVKGQGKAWQSKITAWLKNKKIIIASRKKDADYIISGSVSKASGSFEITTVISNFGGVEEVSFPMTIKKSEESKLRKLLFEKLEKFPYVLNR